MSHTSSCDYRSIICLFTTQWCNIAEDCEAPAPPFSFLDYSLNMVNIAWSARPVPAEEAAVISEDARPGAYVLHLTLTRNIQVRIKTLGERELSQGSYLYVGSAKRGMATRCARHGRLADQKAGKIRWHVDHLLVDPRCKLTSIEYFPGAEECRISRRIARRKGITAPIPRFGATDCRSGCRAHLYRVQQGGDREGEG